MGSQVIFSSENFPNFVLLPYFTAKLVTTVKVASILSMKMALFMHLTTMHQTPKKRPKKDLHNFLQYLLKWLHQQKISYQISDKKLHHQILLRYI